MNTGELKLQLKNANDKLIGQRVDIRLRHQELSDFRMSRAVPSGITIIVNNLRRPPQWLCRLEIDPPSYLPVSLLVDINRPIRITTTRF